MLSRSIRRDCLVRCHATQSSHIASCLSCADILAVLFEDVLGDDDRFVLSKAHAHFALDAVCERLEIEEPKGTQPYMGALGHGLPVGCGMALVRHGRVFVLMGDGELEEGTTWEAAAFADAHHLPLTVIVDANGWQALRRCYNFEDFHWRKWRVRRIDGHNHDQLREALSDRAAGPLLVWASTVKGKGVSFMEDDNSWHYRAPDDEEFAKAIAEVSA